MAKGATDDSRKKPNSIFVHDGRPYQWCLSVKVRTRISHPERNREDEN